MSEISTSSEPPGVGSSFKFKAVDKLVLAVAAVALAWTAVLLAAGF